MTRFTRRRFIQSIAGIGAALALPRPAWLATAKQPIQKSIPASGESLPVIGMGTSRTFNVAGDPQSMAQLSAVLDAFFDHGGALIDSSPMYGNAERVLGELLSQTERKNLFAATKVWTDGKRAGVEQMEQSRRLWGVDRFDLMQIHNLRDWRTHLETLKAWKAEGRVRYIGITTSHGRDHEELAAILEREPFDFVQFSYNIDNRIAEERLLPLAADRGMATLINRPFQRGDLFRRIQGKPLPDWASDYDIASWGQFFLKFIASHPAVTCVIPATSKVDHMVDNMGANYGRLPDAETRQRMIQYFES
ncbi:aldo/keto reductase [Methylohalobius crimeensis]|uniref:aldo/keto reductase n=1 Tax=Methylohalobius crimeensis TaxID=244365 RepID=UPI0003B3FEB6|nr:aldo/keto reductase [Methylohalobius crimeensis]